MPSVPTLNDNVNQVGLSKQRFTDNTSIETFGGGQRTQQGFAAAGAMVKAGTDLIIEEKKKADGVQLTQAYADAVKAKNQLMYDPKSGAINKRGQDAFGINDEYMPQFDAAMDEIEGRLGNDEQKAMFKEIRIKQKMDLDGDFQRHVFKESQAFENETMKYGIEAAREDGILNFQTPGKVGESITTQKALILNYAKNSGKSPEWTEMALKGAESDTHKDVLGRMLANGDDLMAQTYFKTVKDSLTSDTLISMEKAVEEGSIRGGSQRIVDNLINKYGSYSAAMKEVKEMDLDPKLRDATQDRLRSEFSIKEQEKNKFLSNMERGAYDILDKSNGDITQIPPTQWTQFDGSTRSALKRYADDKRAGIAAKTDIEKYYYLKELAENPETRDQFQQFDLMKMKPYLSETDMKKFIDVQTEVKKGKTDTLDGWRSDSIIVQQAFRDMGKDVKSDSEEFAQFGRRVEQEQIAMQQKLGRKLNNNEMEQITDRLKINVITERGLLWDTKKRAFEVDLKRDTFDLDIDDVPANEKAAITDALKRNNRPVTTENILKYFRQGITSASK